VVSPAGHEIEDRTIRVILKYLDPQETGLIVHKTRPVEKSPPDILLPMIHDPEARHRDDHGNLRLCRVRVLPAPATAPGSSLELETDPNSGFIQQLHPTVQFYRRASPDRRMPPH
jgi:hypothetical protein